MKPIQLISLLANGGAAVRLESLGYKVSSEPEPGNTGTVVLEAVEGLAIESELRRLEICPARSVALCPNPSGLPEGCLWLSPAMLKEPRGAALLRAWLGDAKEDPVQGLLAQISHDMRSPLSVIATAASLIPKYADDRTRVLRYLGLINESSSVLKSLVNDILDFSKIREGEFAFTTLDFNLRHLMHSITESFKLLVKDPETLAVEWSAHPDVGEFVHGDPGRLRQVLTNLMNNALKFTATGLIELTASLDGGLLRFEVRDTGVGIAEEARDKIFLPYQQANDKVHATFGGTGLGLTICRILVERMGGAIGVESVVGSGSTFWFSANLPTVAPEQPSILPELRGRKIFVGCSTPALFTTSLAAHNSVVAYSTTATVETNLRLENYDMFIIDLELDGFELAQRVSKAVPGCTIVVTTSAGQRGDVAMCQEIGVSGYLTTPIEARELEIALALTLRSGSQDIVTKYSAKELLAQHA